MRYCGSKRRFVKAMLPVLMEHTDEDTVFVDVFCGGANVISEVPLKNKIGVELNKYVCALWKHIQSHGMEGIPDQVTKEEYMLIKADYINKTGKYPDWLIGYVGVCCSYGSAWFNGYANYNPKKKEDHIGEAYRSMEKQVNEFKFLQETEFVNCSYEEFVYPDNSVIYCDPPYAGKKQYESDFDSDAFWEWVRRMSLLGHRVYVSEYTAPDDFKSVWSAIKSDGMSTTLRNAIQPIKVERLFIYNGKKNE